MFEYIPDTVPDTVIVIGAGGTGGRLIPLLAQFMKTMPWVIDPAIILVDDDDVEEKNLLRQNFIKSDVGKKKAVVLAERYSRAFNINIIPVVKRIKGLSSEGMDLFNDRQNSNMSPIIAMCVDSAQARRDIIQSFSELNAYYKPFYIDAGNEDAYGQVTMFHPYVLHHGQYVNVSPSLDQLLKMYNLPSMLPCKVKIPKMYMDLDFYKNMVDKPGGSCADLDQTLAINSMMATTIMGVIQNYYYGKPFSTNRINLAVAQGGSSTMTDTRSMYNIAGIFREVDKGFGRNARLHKPEFQSILSIARTTYDNMMAEIEAKRKAEEEAMRKAAEEAAVAPTGEATPVKSTSRKTKPAVPEFLASSIPAAPIVPPPVMLNTTGI